jgi:hypothetical protein
VVAGDGGLSPSILSGGDRLLWWLSKNGEGTDGSGGPRGSFRDGWLGTRGITPVCQQSRVVARAWLDFCKILRQGSPI